jgi:hypothetical protein
MEITQCKKYLRCYAHGSPAESTLKSWRKNGKG